MCYITRFSTTTSSATPLWRHIAPTPSHCRRLALGYRRLEPHDRNQLELKLSYLVPPDCARHTVTTEVFLFTPRTLGVTHQSYPTQRFFEDTTRFIRLKTPDIALAELADPECARALFVESGAQSPAEWRVRLLGCVYRRSIRDARRALTRRYDALDAAREQGPGGGVDPEELEGLLRDTCDFARALGAAMPSLQVILSESDCGRTGLAVDEFVSLVAEAACTRLVEAMDGLNAGAGEVSGDGSEPGSLSDLTQARELLAEAAVAQYRHRRSRGYASFAHQGDDNEGLPYRRRLLKRAMSRALYLDIGHERAGDLAQNLAGMLAASAAMLFAIVVAVWAQLRWEMTTWPFIAVMVISYAIKDRIKEFGKRILGKRVKRFAPDVVLKVRMPSTGGIVGVCREWFSMQSPEHLDPDILRIRHIDHPETLDELARPETVMVYRKEVALKAKGLRQCVAEVEGLTDIIRFNLSRLRRRMDAPTEIYTLVHPETQALVEVPCGRVYHLNIVMRTTAGSGAGAKVELERVRAVLDQGGIRRVERVYPDEALTNVEPAGLDEMGDSPDLV